MRRYSLELRKAVKSSLRGDRFTVSESQIDDIGREMTDLMVYSYLRRFQLHPRRRRQVIEMRLPRTSLDRDVADLSDRFELNLENLRDKFRTLTGRNLRRSLQEVRRRLDAALEESTRRRLSERSGTRLVLREMARLGVTPSSDHYIRTIVRTHTQIGYNSAVWVRYRNDIDVFGFRYMTVGDDRVRESHERLHNVVRKRLDAFWDVYWPPNGWNCRCQAVPVFTKVRQTRVPQVSIDDEFSFNPGQLVLST